jgi:hypothetical protein
MTVIRRGRLGISRLLLRQSMMKGVERNTEHGRVKNLFPPTSSLLSYTLTSLMDPAPSMPITLSELSTFRMILFLHGTQNTIPRPLQPAPTYQKA